MIELNSANAYQQLHEDQRRVWSVPRPENDRSFNSELVDPSHGGARVYGNICKSLDFTPRFTFERNAKVFTIGSCFAREVEEVLLPLGFDVLTRDIGTYAYPHGYLNRYNSAAMLQELEYANGDRKFQKDSIVRLRSGYADLTSYGQFDTLEEVLEHRHRTTALFRKLREADVVIVTAGLSEVWFDRTWSHYTNIAPSEAARNEEHRFEFRALDFATTRHSLNALVSLIRTQANRARIILTVSPVPLNATFLARDVLISNCYSKAALRSAVEELYWKNSDVDYFPSYEMAALSDPNLVWEHDRRHVRRSFVGDIMEAFLSRYVAEPSE